jgi:hypothetical protein
LDAFASLEPLDPHGIHGPIADLHLPKVADYLLYDHVSLFWFGQGTAAHAATVWVAACHSGSVCDQNMK